MFGHDEKISSIRLTAAQYIILAIFLILARTLGGTIKLPFICSVVRSYVTTR